MRTQLLRATSATMVLACLACGCCSNHDGVQDSGETRFASILRALLVLAGDPSVTEGERSQARDFLTACSDPEVIPLLIEYSTDTRVSLAEQDPLDEDSPSGSSALTVGAICRRMLRVWFAGRRYREFKVSDWKTWYQLRRTRSVTEIRREVAEQLDASKQEGPK